VGWLCWERWGGCGGGVGWRQGGEEGELRGRVVGESGKSDGRRRGVSEDVLLEVKGGKKGG